MLTAELISQMRQSIEKIAVGVSPMAQTLSIPAIMRTQQMTRPEINPYAVTGANPVALASTSPGVAAVNPDAVTRELPAAPAKVIRRIVPDQPPIPQLRQPPKAVVNPLRTQEIVSPGNVLPPAVSQALSTKPEVVTGQISPPPARIESEVSTLRGMRPPAVLPPPPQPAAAGVRPVTPNTRKMTSTLVSAVSPAGRVERAVSEIPVVSAKSVQNRFNALLPGLRKAAPYALGGTALTGGALLARHLMRKKRPTSEQLEQ
jgi:hypothetical protein